MTFVFADAFRPVAGDARPLYVQLYEALREAMLDGRLATGTRLPASRVLAGELGVSRNTVSAAVAQLVAEGFVVSHVGRGSFVAAPPSLSPTKPAVDGACDVASAPGMSRRGRMALALGPRAPETRPLAFAPGVPELGELDMTLWSRLSAKAWREATRSQLGYGDPGGWEPLREAIVEYVRTCRGVRCTAEQVLITCGAQQALDLCARVLTDVGDPVWIEEPGYRGAVGAWLAAGAEVVPVGLDDEGLDVVTAERAGVPKPRLIYVTPSHQYPTGVTMSLARRSALLDYARRHDAWIVEDDYDSEYRYRDRPLAALQGLDPDGRVLYVGAFSKVLFPSLRIGYLVAPTALVAALRQARTFLDSHPSTVNQVVLAEWMRQGAFVRHIRRMRALYEKRRDVLAQLIEEHLAPVLTAPLTDGGMHLTAYADDGFDDVACVRQAAAAGVEARALSQFFRGPEKQRGLVLGYAGYNAAAMQLAMAKLKKVVANA